MFKELLYSKGIIDSLEKDQFNVPCMNHNETSGRSLSINFEKNIFKCFSGKCNNFKGSIQQLCSHLGYTSSITSLNFQNNYKKQFQTDDIETFDYSKYLQWNNNDLSYLTKRRIPEDILKLNKVVNVNFMKRIFVPFTFNNKIYGTVGRTLLTDVDKQIILQSYENKYFSRNLFELHYDDIPEDFAYIKYYRINERYTNSKNLPKKELIYEPISNNYRNDYLFITEGIFNTFSINALGNNSVAIIGSQPSINHIQIIKSKYADRKIVTAFDNDDAGIKSRNAFNKLYGTFLPFVSLPSKINDINDLINTYKNIDLIRLVKFF
jgi:hypothetical protein